MNTRDTKNPLVRDGVAQQQRKVPALSPDYAQVDETDLADFLVFAYDLSQQVVYYNEKNQVDGNWRNFFAFSTPVQLALISKTRPESVQNAYNQALKAFLAQWAIAPVTVAATEPRLRYLEDILDLFVGILKTLQTWDQGLEEGTPLKSVLRASVTTTLQRPFNRLYQLKQGLWFQQWLPNQRTPEDYTVLSSFATAFGLETVRPEYSSSLAELGDFPPVLALHRTITNRTQAQSELNSIFQPLFQTYLRMIQQAPGALHESLTVDQSLPPHLALYVAFWQVLQPARRDLNRMTERHLDFFYRQVLRLSERPAQPDKAHIILELAKFVQDHPLERQTRISGGTDATGVDLVYVLNDEIVVNTAQAVELKGIFRHSQAKQGAPADDPNQEILGLHASPVANSFDGQGGKFPKDLAVQAWLPFGNEMRPTAEVGLAIASNILLLNEGDRTLTFKLTLGFSTPPNVPAIVANLQQELRVEFSGEAEWIRGAIATPELRPAEAPSTLYTLTIQVTLPVGAAPVVPYHADLPGGKLATTHPVARLTLHHQDDQPTPQAESRKIAEDQLSAYHDLRQATLEAIDITVKVDGVRNLLLQNDLATLEASKPFLPFGVQPKLGSSFYIGSQEVFQKRLTRLKLAFDLETEPPYEGDTIHWERIYAAYGIDARINWAETYAAYGVSNPNPGVGNPVQSFHPGRLAIDALRARQWHPAASTEYTLFSRDQLATGSPQYCLDLTEDLSALKLDRSVTDPSPAVELAPWSNESQYGFLRSQLIGDDFLHTAYPTVLARQVLATATQEIIPVSPEEQQESRKPTEARKRKAVIGAYYKYQTVEVSQTTPPTTTTREAIFQADKYFVELNDVPILPEEPYTPVIKSLQVDYTAIATYKDCQLFHLYPFDGFAAVSVEPSASPAIPFLPQFDNEGELLVGLQNLEPSTALCLLFEVVEETADTDLEKADVGWHYLKGNAWHPFEKYQILKDTSNGLIHSGIVKLAVPADISNVSTTILNPSLHWIKATVKSRSRAICQIIRVQTQAAEVTFVDDGNDPNHLATPLPAEKLTKLVDPQPEIKQIQHPFPSFGGKVKEQPAQFYTRVSEHLHHKGRAITIFDYERLVLDRFPEIYKVRCINHGEVIPNGNCREIAPGHLTLAVIPTLSQRRTINNLKPKVNISLLAEIQQYLKSLSSPWVSVHVINPDYQEIRVELKVRFKDPFQSDFDFYRRQLESEIVGFLSPWTVDGGAEIHFGGEIYLSSILNFVEERPYVNFVLDFQLFQKEQGEEKGQQNEQEKSVLKATVSSPQSILVSVPPFANAPFRHVIDAVPKDWEAVRVDAENHLNRVGYSARMRLRETT